MFCPRFIRDIHILVCTRMDTIMDDSNRSFLLSWSFCGCLKRVEITRLEGKKKKIERERERERETVWEKVGEERVGFEGAK